jgi:hypothetical protein
MADSNAKKRKAGDLSQAAAAGRNKSSQNGVDHVVGPTFKVSSMAHMACLHAPCIHQLVAAALPPSMKHAANVQLGESSVSSRYNLELLQRSMLSEHTGSNCH